MPFNPIPYVTGFPDFFTPPPSLSRVVTFLRHLPTYCDVTYFEILHLEIIKLKKQFRNYISVRGDTAAHPLLYIFLLNSLIK